MKILFVANTYICKECLKVKSNISQLTDYFSFVKATRKFLLQKANNV